PDFSSDPLNCGQCGRSCLGGTCTKGDCSHVMMSTGVTRYDHIALYDDSVYWTSGGSIYKLPKTADKDATPTTVLANFHADFIVVNAIGVFCSVATDMGAINFFSHAGGSPVTRASNQFQPRGLTLYGEMLYWATCSTPGVVRTVNAAGGQVTNVSLSLE